MDSVRSLSAKKSGTFYAIHPYMTPHMVVIVIKRSLIVHRLGSFSVMSAVCRLNIFVKLAHIDEKSTVSL